MHIDETAPRRRKAQPSALVGVPAGLLAGVAYLLAQVLFALWSGGTGSEPVQRIAAILLGPDAAPPPAEWSATVCGIALIIHLPLSALYGRVVDVVVMAIDDMFAAALAGAVVGALMYVLHRWFIAPVAFPWFEASRSAATALDHVLFGVVAALGCVVLRRRQA